MRWSMRRGGRAGGPSAAAASPPEPADAPVAVAAPAEPLGVTGLAPLTPTWAARPPLTTVVAPPAPSILDRTPQPGDGAPGPGRVVGLAGVTSRRPVGPAVPALPPADRTPEYGGPAPLRHAPVRPLVERAPLTEATDAFVGTPVAAAPPPPPAPAPPPPPPAAPRAPAMTEAGARFQEALANLASSGLPRYDPHGDGTPPPPPPAPRPAAPDPGPEDDEPAPPRLLHRRTLAESRRFGLGAPVQDAGGPVPGAPDLPPAAPAANAARTADAATTDTTDTTAAPNSTAPRPAARPDDPRPDDPPNSGPGGPPPPVTPTVRPLVGGAPRTSRAVAPLRFRSAPPPPPDRAPAAPPERGVITRPPAQLAQALRASHGIEVADVPVRQDAEATHEATRRRARAFTRGATVYLPETLDVHGSQQARALLAHELVHAVQQQRLGGALPGEDTAAGQELEREALEAERRHGGAPELTSAEPLRHAPPPVTSSWVEDRLTQHARWDPPFTEFQRGSTSDLSERAVEEIQWNVQEIVARAITDAGGASKLGGGGLGGSSDLDKTAVGAFRATNIDDFKRGVLGQYNLEREMQGLPPVSGFTADESRLLQEQFDNAEKERKAAIAAKEAAKLSAEAEATKQAAAIEAKKTADAAAEADRSAQKLDGVQWTPVLGFHRRDGKQAPAAPAGGEKDVSLTAAGAWVPGAAPDTGGATGGTAGGTAAGTAGGDATAASDAAKVDAALAKATPAAPAASAAVVAKPGVPRPWAVDLLDPNPEVTQFKVRTVGEFIPAALQAYNVERALQGLGSVDAFSGEDLNFLQQQFNQARADALLNNKVAAERKDDQRRREERAQALAVAAAASAAQGQADTAPAELATTSAAATSTVDAAPAAAPVVTTASSLATAPHAEVAANSVTFDKLDELTDRIYDRVRTKLRTELLIDRERAGLLTDFR